MKSLLSIFILLSGIAYGQHVPVEDPYKMLGVDLNQVKAWSQNSNFQYLGLAPHETIRALHYSVFRSKINGVTVEFKLLNEFVRDFRKDVIVRIEVGTRDKKLIKSLYEKSKKYNGKWVTGDQNYHIETVVETIQRVNRAGEVLTVLAIYMTD